MHISTDNHPHHKDIATTNVGHAFVLVPTLSETAGLLPKRHQPLHQNFVELEKIDPYDERIHSHLLIILVMIYTKDSASPAARCTKCLHYSTNSIQIKPNSVNGYQV
jgi:hypothetical protein